MGIKNFYLPPFLRCPLCGAALSVDGGSLYCGGERRHTYDIAKEGYVNLLPPGRAKNARTGDGADMIRARENFLALGGYDRYSSEAALFAAGFIDPSVCSADDAFTVIDAGCGEGRHTVNMAAAFAEALGCFVDILGVDASKFGAQAAAKKYVKNGSHGQMINPCFVAGNIFSLPVADSSADVLTSLFAPLPGDEAGRVLKKGGLIVICAAGGGHLAEMRSVLYENPVPSGGGAVVPDGFTVVGETVIEYPLELSSPEDIMALFTMTPFYHNAPPVGRAKLEALTQLTVTVQVKCTVAKKEDPAGE